MFNEGDITEDELNQLVQIVLKNESMFNWNYYRLIRVHFFQSSGGLGMFLSAFGFALAAVILIGIISTCCKCNIGLKIVGWQIIFFRIG